MLLTAPVNAESRKFTDNNKNGLIKTLGFCEFPKQFALQDEALPPLTSHIDSTFIYIPSHMQRRCNKAQRSTGPVHALVGVRVQITPVLIQH